MLVVFCSSSDIPGCAKLILLFPFANRSKDDDSSCQFEGQELVDRREKAFLTSVDIMELEVASIPATVYQGKQLISICLKQYMETKLRVSCPNT